MLPKVKLESNYTSFTTRKYMQPGEIELLLTLLQRVQPLESMIEIGVNEGLTARAVLESSDAIGYYVGVDVRRDHEMQIPAQQIEIPEEPGRLVKHDSRFKLLIREESPLLEDREFDAAFIDGDHGYDAVMVDYYLAKSSVRPGGIIIFHDYNNPTVQVTQALDYLYSRGCEIVSVDGTWLAYEMR